MSSYDDHLAALRTQIVRLVRTSTGIHEQEALSIASKIINVMREKFAGDRIYVAGRDPKRNQAILAEFNGRNGDEVCAKYSIHRATLYRLLKRRPRV